MAALGELHAAGGAQEESHVERFLQALNGAAGQGRRGIQLPGGGRKATCLNGLHKHLDVIQPDHFRENGERLCPYKPFSYENKKIML
jgi:hypothetical protein